MKQFLYLVHSGLGIMIGRTSHIYRRFAVIDSYSPLEVKLYRVYRTKRSGLLEMYLRRKYNKKKIRTGWFDLNPADLEEIDEYLRKNKAIRILDNSKKIRGNDRQKSPETVIEEYRDLHGDIEKLEQAVQRLWKALYGK
mgnify:CR=1 FL=1